MDKPLTFKRTAGPVFCLLMALFSSAMAQTDTSAYELETVVMTGQHSAVAASQSVYRVQVIDRARIEAQAAQQLGDLLSQELNINLQQDLALGTFMSLQGTSGQHIKILIDGVPMIGRLDGGLDLGQINLHAIERIEIIEGPMSVEYGTHALGGVINLITAKSPKSAWEAGFSLYEATTGDRYSIYDGFHNQSAYLGWRHARHSLRLDGARNFFGGDALEADSRFKSWKPKDQRSGSLSYAFTEKKYKLEYSSSYFDEDLINRGNADLYGERALDEQFRTRRINQRLNARFELPGKSTFDQIAAYSWYRRDRELYRRDLVRLESQPMESEFRTDLYDAWLLRGTWAKAFSGEKASLQAGYDLNFESTEGDRILGGERQHISDAAAFASLEYRPVPTLSLRPGLRAARNSRFAAPLAPSLHLKYDLHPAWSLRFSYARGFRAPSLKELYFEFVDSNHSVFGNADLEAEYSHNLQLSATYRRLSAGGHLFKAEGGVFYNAFRNQIDLLLTGNGIEAVYFNLTESYTQGLESRFSWKYAHFSATAGLALTGRYNYLYETAGEEIDAFSYAPNAHVQIQHTWKKAGIHTAVFYKYTGAIQGFFQDGNGLILPTRIGDYHLLDANLRRRFWQERIDLTLGVKNLLNVRNVPLSGSSGAAHSGGSSSPVALGRNLFVNLQFHFSKK